MKNKSYEHKYYIADRVVVWHWDADESNAANFLSDNLYILNETGEKIWSMKNVLKHEDCCVSLAVSDNAKIRFITFNGLNVTFDVERLEVISMQMTR